MHRFGPETVFATYRVRKGRERTFLALLRRHWPVLRREGLVTAEPSLVFRGKDESGGTVITEIFTWTGKKAVQTAHHHPAVSEVWSAMGALVESRGGRPQWEFPHLRPVSMPFARRAPRGRRKP